MKLPFEINRNGAEPLTSQIEQGVVRGIETGFWKPGDILPMLDSSTRLWRGHVVIVDFEKGQEPARLSMSRV